jgi:hypothetical protein
MTDQSEEPANAPETASIPPQGTAPQADEIEIGWPLSKEVADALRLLDYAIRAGFKAGDGTTVDDHIREPIVAMVARLGLGCRPPTSDDTCVAVPRTEWLAFCTAYEQLARLLRPVTAATLEATAVDDAPRASALGTIFHYTTWLWGQSAALRFTRWLWVWTTFFAVAVIVSQWLEVIYGPPVPFDETAKLVAPNDWNRARLLVETLVPFAYGGLGSCVYLLRSAHSFIAERTFDDRRKPEYYNRILLGVISGGTILLFTRHLADGNEQVIAVSGAALGFLAGYSTEFLFQAIERVIAAILPRVGLDSVQRARPAHNSVDVPVGNLTLEDLVDRFAAATTPEEKTLYRGLIDKLAERM